MKCERCGTELDTERTKRAFKSYSGTELRILRIDLTAKRAKREEAERDCAEAESRVMEERARSAALMKTLRDVRQWAEHRDGCHDIVHACEAALSQSPTPEEKKT